MNHGTMAAVGHLPLPTRAVEIALVKKVAQTLLEPRLRSAAHELMDVRRGQIAIARQRAEDIEIAGSQFDPLASGRAAHPRAASDGIHVAAISQCRRDEKRAPCSVMHCDD